MIKVKYDLTGKIFGRLTVLEQAEDYIYESGYREAQWLCICSCSDHNTIKALGSSLRKGHTRSCGCLQKENASLLGKINKKYNKYSELLHDEYGDYYIGYTNNTGAEFYIDAEDYEKIKDYNWHETHTGSTAMIKTNINGKTIKMHQLLGFTNYDHKDRNELNNRKYNLRLCTKQENSMNSSKSKNNTSGIIGVYWDKQNEKWMASIGINYKSKYLGRFINKNDAIKARLLAEIKCFGEFAPQKHLFEKYGIKEDEAKSIGGVG